jgi:NAD-dependent DNA ligase
MGLDAHGQPINRRYNAARLSDRLIDELIGLSRGVAADGIVTIEEAKFLSDWLEANRKIADAWPAKVIYERVREMLSDGILDEEEQHELLGMLKDLTGGSAFVPNDAASLSSKIPFTDPEPPILFDKKSFCFTGKFIYGTRKECQSAVIERGSNTQSSPSRKTDFLVIGVIGSTDWIHSSHGRKIEKAVELRESGFPIEIVSEQHWVDNLVEQP